MAQNIPPGTKVWHVASPNFPGHTTKETKEFNRHGYEKKMMVLVRYPHNHPKFDRREIYCDPDLLCLTQEEAQERHIPEDVYNKIESIIES